MVRGSEVTGRGYRGRHGAAHSSSVTGLRASSTGSARHRGRWRRAQSAETVPPMIAPQRLRVAQRHQDVAEHAEPDAEREPAVDERRARREGQSRTGWIQFMIDPLPAQDHRRGRDERRVELLAGVELAEPGTGGRRRGSAASACRRRSTGSSRPTSARAPCRTGRTCATQERHEDAESRVDVDAAHDRLGRGRVTGRCRSGTSTPVRDDDAEQRGVDPVGDALGSR